MPYHLVHTDSFLADSLRRGEDVESTLPAHDRERYDTFEDASRDAGTTFVVVRSESLGRTTLTGTPVSRLVLADENEARRLDREERLTAAGFEEPSEEHREAQRTTLALDIQLRFGSDLPGSKDPI